MSTYTVIYERDRTGWWVASVAEVPGCHTQGKSIDQARRRIREALSLFVKAANRATLVDDIRLPSSATEILEKVTETRKRVESDQAELQHSTRVAATKLTKSMGMSVRDAGVVLGLSYQRVQQLVGTPAAAKTATRSGALPKSAKRAKSTRK